MERHEHMYSLIFTSDGETLRCDVCEREWLAVPTPPDSRSDS